MAMASPPVVAMPVMAPPPASPPVMAPPPASPSVLAAGGDRSATQPAVDAQRRRAAFEAWSDRLRGLVRDIRVEAEHLVHALDAVDAALVQTKADGPHPELDAATSAFVTAKVAHVAVVAERFGDLRALFDLCPSLYDTAGDEVAEVANLWNEALAAAPTAAATPDACRVNDPIARRALGDIAWHTALITIPNRVTQHLGQLRVGGQLKFDDTFADELPDPAQRTRMLEYLKAHPGAVSGIVDVGAGVIYAASRSSRRRMASIVLLLALVALGFAIIRVATAGIPGVIASNWLFPSDRFADLVGAYILLFVGAAIHIVIEAIKQQQRSGPGSFLAIDDWLLWLHVREVSNAVSIMSLWAVVFLLAAAYANGIDRLSALFAGYSLDSVLGIAITRFDTFASSRVSAVEKTVSG
jgi:hypothetical protein